MRKFKKHFVNDGIDSVINLSSSNITYHQKMLLSLGCGFIPSSKNKNKEEEILILEGFRVINRIGDLDERLSNLSDNTSINNDNKDNNNKNESFSQIASQIAQNEDVEEFIRDKTIPYCLRYFQPRERDLRHGVTKQLKKEFEEMNQKCINMLYV